MMTGIMGHYIYAIPLIDKARFLNACLTYGVELGKQKEKDGHLMVYIPFLRSTHFERVMEHVAIPYDKSVLKGVLGVARRLSLHPGLIVGAVLSLILFLWLGGMVWEVRISSPADIDEDTVLSHLSACGLKEGVRLSQIDTDAVTAAYLLNDTQTAFLSIHLNGVVAEVELIPKDEGKTDETLAPPCNIVASRPALVTDVTVYRGKSLVRVGDTVAEGDLLVSGIITDVGGTRVLGAVADVVGLIKDEVRVEVPLVVEQTRVQQGTIKGVELSFFGLRFRMGDIGEEYTKEGTQMYLFGFIRLPVRLTTYREVTTSHNTLFYTEDEANQMAQARLRQQVGILVGDGTLVTYETQTECDGKTLVLCCQIEYEGNIAKALAFEVGN